MACIAASELWRTSAAWTAASASARTSAGVVPIGVLAPGDESDTMRDALARAGAARVLDHVTDLEELLP